MKIISRREIILTRERCVTIRFGNAAENFCSACNEAVQFITVDEAALIGNVSRQTIFQMIGNGRLHRDEASERLLRVCLQSLTSLNAKNNEEK